MQVEGVRSPVDSKRRILGVLFDVDGTLYAQQPLRWLMAIELVANVCRSPFGAPATLRALRHYRRHQETLRGKSGGSIAETQILAAATAAEVSPDLMRQLVDEWMHARPLKYLKWVKAQGLESLVTLLRSRSVVIGVLSDYPAGAKLGAIGLGGAFSPVLCSTDASIDALKPNPRGFLRACELWGLEPENVLMVGDRVEVDAVGASAAGMPSVIISRRTPETTLPDTSRVMPSLIRLREVLEHGT